ncbi:MAG: monofunctional biosynthetic peptidoglycan transglycosylase [marine benthic group bacterium]|nr:monofunctional biosynthetic peptidoglycan transglycosylase [Gemmatimonadota bacterium]
MEEESRPIESEVADPTAGDREEVATESDGTSEPPIEQVMEESAVPRVAWRRHARLAAIVTACTLALWLLYTWITWPDVASLRTEYPSTTAFIEMYREARRAAGENDAVAWQVVPYERISANLKRAVVAAEDTEFFFHEGFSTHEMKEALKKAIREGEAPRGASTITQQLAKNLWLTPSRTLTRKFREAMLTRQLEKKLSKDRILDLYLNVVEFGPGIYGAEAASLHYFGLPASGLSPRQGAMLAAGLPRKRWNPASDSEYYRASVERILEVQRQLEYLDRYLGPSNPGSIGVDPPEVPALTP